MNITKSYTSSSFNAPFLLQNLGLLQQEPQPLATGNEAPDFTLFTKNGVWQHLPEEISLSGTVSLETLLENKPLVVSFYSPYWQNYGHLHIEHLNKLYSSVKALGGDLLVLTPEPVENIRRIVKYYDLPFNIAQDINNQIAAEFGLYSAAHPVWDRIAGIEGEVALPATYVISQNQQIVYDFADADFSTLVPAKEVLTAVYNRKLKKSA